MKPLLFLCFLLIAALYVINTLADGLIHIAAKVGGVQ